MSRSVSTPYLDMIAKNQQSLIADLYTFKTRSGTNDYFTDIDADINYGGHTYKSGSLRITGLRMKLSVGLQVDEQEIKVAALPEDTLAGALFLEGLVQGLLDGAYLQRDRAVWAPTSATPHAIYTGTTPVTVFRMSLGLVSEITKIGRTHVEMKIKSPMRLLDQPMPRSTYQASCNYALFDPDCTLSKASFAWPGIVDPTPGPTILPWQGGVPSVTGTDGYPYFAQGRVLFMDGVLTGEQFYITTNDSTNLYVIGLINPPTPGDTFNAYPGCSKLKQTCDLKFSNVVNFGGFPYVPPVILGV